MENPIKAIASYFKEDPINLENFFIKELKDIYWAEQHLTMVLPEMAKAATSEDLKLAISNHLAETEEHVTRLESVFDLLGIEAEGNMCDAIDGITTEGESVIGDTADNTLTRDVGIIVSCQKVEHYEIAAYGSLVQLAKTLRKTEIADILLETLEEEKNADTLLTQIAESHINEEAFQE